MSISTITLSRIMKEASLSFDDFPFVGFASTHSADANITDSAAAGTALATGFKTKNGMIGVTPDNKARKTILEAAKEAGKKVGIVTTTTISHATPASFTSHVSSRSKEQDIAKQQLELKPNVMLGGGLRFFESLFDDAKSAGYDVVLNSEELIKSSNDYVLGVFTSSHMNYDIDREASEPSIALMVRKAIDLLNNDKGFFLIVEGGRIDHAAHSNDPIGTIYDLFAFEKAVKEAYDFARRRKDTLVVVTSDHETGGLVLGRKGYSFNPEALKNFTNTPDIIVSKINKEFSDLKEVIKTHTGYDLEDDDVKRMLKHKDSPRPSRYSAGGLATSSLLWIINNKANIAWTTNDHAGGMVPVYAFGPGAEKFTGTMDNTDIPKRIFSSFDIKNKVLFPE
jgi:alkaline phosphatase